MTGQCRRQCFPHATDGPSRACSRRPRCERQPERPPPLDLLGRFIPGGCPAHYLHHIRRRWAAARRPIDAGVLSPLPVGLGRGLPEQPGQAALHEASHLL